jgi:PKD repeat protein
MLIYSDFNHYNGGIYRYNGNADLLGGHAVIIVGYDEDEEYLICKNSWGTSWGEEGYFRIPHGECWLGNEIYFVDIDDSLNFPPQATCAGPYAGNINEAIQFSSDDTVDLDDNIETYSWDFGDGTTSFDRNPIHSYDESGVYPVTLTVTDSFGKESVDETAVFIDMWNVDDYWTYQVCIDSIPDAFYPPIRLPFDGEIPELTLTVVEENEESYILDLAGSLKGNLSFVFDLQKSIFDFRLWSKILNGNIDGSINVDKKGFGITDLELRIKGFANAIFLPIVPLPLWIFTPFDVTVQKTFDEPRPLMTSAPDVGNSLNIPSVNSSNKMSMSLFFGLLSNTFESGEIIDETIYSCSGSEEISTPTGRFNCFKYTLDSSDSFKESELFYAPDIRNVARFSGGDTEVFTYTGELISTNVE